MKSQVIFALVAIVAAIGLLVSANNVYAESILSGGGFNNGPSHNHCTAAASGVKCTPFSDNGQHTGLLN